MTAGGNVSLLRAIEDENGSVCVLGEPTIELPCDRHDTYFRGLYRVSSVYRPSACMAVEVYLVKF